LPSGQTLLGGGSVTNGLTSSAGSTVAPGSTNTTGTLTVSGAVTLGGATYMKLSGATNDQVNSLTNIVYGGTLIVTNIGSALSAGSNFALFHGTSYSGSFTSITLPTLGSSLFWQTNLSVNGTISVVGPSSPIPNINSVSQSGSNLIFSGTNGPASGTYYVLTSTNLALPVSSWTRLSTNSFSASGTFSVTNPIVTSGPPGFFVVEVP